MKPKVSMILRILVAGAAAVLVPRYVPQMAGNATIFVVIFFMALYLSFVVFDFPWPRLFMLDELQTALKAHAAVMLPCPRSSGNLNEPCTVLPQASQYVFSARFVYDSLEARAKKFQHEFYALTVPYLLVNVSIVGAGIVLEGFVTISPESRAAVQAVQLVVATLSNLFFIGSRIGVITFLRELSSDSAKKLS